MIKSMTGYGRGRTESDGLDVYAEVKSVNGRYLDIFVRAPKIYGFMDEKIRAKISKSISRGKVEVYVSIDNLNEQKVNLSLNSSYIESYIALLKNIRDTYRLPDDITTMRVAQNREIFNIEKPAEDEERLWQRVSETLDTALEEYNAMRCAEGGRLLADMECRMAACEALTEKIYAASEENKDKYFEVLRQRINEIIKDAGMSADENRIVTEAAVFADKISVTEEVIRLRSHFSQFKNIMREKNPIGRKIDFLIQEINREINTIGSKSQDFGIAAEVIEMKSEVEKIREQIQNIE